MTCGWGQLIDVGLSQTTIENRKADGWVMKDHNAEDITTMVKKMWETEPTLVCVGFDGIFSFNFGCS